MTCKGWVCFVLGLGTPEVQQVAVSVLDFKPEQTIIVYPERCKKLDIARREFCGQCIRIRNMNVCVPTGNAFFDIPSVVRHGLYTDFFYNDHRSPSLDNAEENVLVTGPLECDIEAETIAVKRQCDGDISDDKEWCNACNLCFGRVRLNHNIEFSCADNSILRQTPFSNCCKKKLPGWCQFNYAKVL